MSKLFINACVLVAMFAATANADPMRPPSWLGGKASSSKQTKPNEALRLQQILRSEDRLLAIINGKVLEKGQKISGAKVLRIKENSVELRIGSRKKVLLLTPGIKATRKNSSRTKTKDYINAN